jgi:predicted enzyme involved in methoxymalonyl-ACP biosynthesis
MLDIDTWLMSCRVIGRTMDTEMLMHLSAAAHRLGCTLLQGTYVPTAKNQLVERVYATHGFTLAEQRADGTTTWRYDIAANGSIKNNFCGDRRR